MIDIFKIGGCWINGCGKEFFFSEIKVLSKTKSRTILNLLLLHFVSQKTWSSARQFCCSIGTTLISLESFGLTGCLYRMLARFPYASAMIFILKIFSQTKYWFYFTHRVPKSFWGWLLDLGQQSGLQRETSLVLEQ
jgi:hypothetical protein